VYFSNPGVRDFLSSVIVEDQLLSSVVQSVGTIEELDNAWDFYRAHYKECRSQMGNESMWTGSLDRIKGTTNPSIINVVRLGLEMCGRLDANAAALKLTEDTLKLLKSQGVDASDETACRHALERFQDLSLDEREALPSSETLVQAAANMLCSCGDRLSLDEINAVATAIDVYGEEPQLAKSAASDALHGFLVELTERLSDVSSTSEMESFEDDLTRTLSRYGVTFDSSIERKLSEHREYLEEKEAERENEGYATPVRPARDADVSDADVQSLFATLLHEQSSD
jgi:hypothetical protein